MNIGDRVEYIGTAYFFEEPPPVLGTIVSTWEWKGAGGFEVEFDYHLEALESEGDFDPAERALACFVEELRIVVKDV